MRVLFVASECHPLVKTGGLADVVGALPAALAAFGCDVRVLLPLYPEARQRAGRLRAVCPLPDLFGGDATVLAGRADGGPPVLCLDAPHLFDRAGSPYLGPDGSDWPDNPARFAALSWAAAEIGRGGAGGWVPDVVHAHDWQAGLVPVYLRAHGGPRPATVFTIHNIAFQGLCDAAALAALRLPAESFTWRGLEFHGRISFLKAGLVYAERLSTVSPTYAQELRTPAFGMGLEGVLRERAAVFTGILNGIDEAAWDPARDPAIAASYDRRRLAGKARNKRALQDALGLSPDGEGPLFGVVSRLTAQKGVDLLLEGVPTLLDGGGQLAVLGSGEPALEQALVEAAGRHPGRIAVRLGFDDGLAHRIQAGADALLVPSRFEPCGLTQMYALRYGTLPIVSRTGGLADTVIDANVAALAAGVATGFQVSPIDADGLRFGIERACTLFRSPDRWRRVQRRAMGHPVGWADSAARYLALYEAARRDAHDGTGPPRPSRPLGG